MPQLNHKGPEGNGPKTGRKLGKCKKSENEKSDSAIPIVRLRKRIHSLEGIGKRQKDE